MTRGLDGSRRGVTIGEEEEDKSRRNASNSCEYLNAIDHAYSYKLFHRNYGVEINTFASYLGKEVCVEVNPLHSYSIRMKTVNFFNCFSRRNLKKIQVLTLKKFMFSFNFYFSFSKIFFINK